MPYIQFPDGEVLKVDDPEDFTGGVRISDRKGKALKMAQSRESLKRICPEKTIVYVVLRTVAKSGMSRTMSLFVVVNGRLVDVTYQVAHALGWPLREVKGGLAIRVDGCGTDAGFEVVSSLSWALHNDDYSLKHQWI